MVAVDTSTFLERAECVRRLGPAGFGRLAITLDALPWIVPVRYAFDGSRIVVDVGADTEIAAAAREAVVAFEADVVDPTTGEPWSVIAVGVAHGVRQDVLFGRDCVPGQIAAAIVAIDPEIMKSIRLAAAPRVAAA
jgi:hypothetical protein